MILKVEDALKSLSRTDPESGACRDLGALIPAVCNEKIRKFFLSNTSSACGEVVYSLDF